MSYPYDLKTVMSDAAAAYVVSGIGQVGGANAILDMGGPQTRPDLGLVGGLARINATVVIDVLAIAVAVGDQYIIAVMGSNSPNGANPVNLGSLILGAGAQIPNGTAGSAETGAGSDSSPGRFELLFASEQDGINYEFVYLFNKILAGSIQYRASMSILPNE
jgi:hypothetical protein